MPAWIHDRAKRLEPSMRKMYGPEKAKQVAFAVATQIAHAAGKSPKTWKGEPFGTAKGRREAKAKFDKSKSEYQKTADPSDRILQRLLHPVDAATEIRDMLKEADEAEAKRRLRGSTSTGQIAQAVGQAPVFGLPGFLAPLPFLQARAMLGRIRKNEEALTDEERELLRRHPELRRAAQGGAGKTYPISRLMTHWAPQALAGAGVGGGLGVAAAQAMDMDPTLLALLGAAGGGIGGAALSGHARSMHARQVAEQEKRGSGLLKEAQGTVTEMVDDPSSQRMLRMLLYGGGGPTGPMEGAQFREERPVPELRGKTVEAAAPTSAEALLDKLMGPMPRRGGAKTLSGELARLRQISEGGGLEDTPAALAGKVRELAKSEGSWMAQHAPSRQKAGSDKQATIRQEGNQYVLYSRDGSRVLSRHNSPEAAMAQERAALLSGVQGKVAFDRLAPHVMGELERLQKEAGFIDSAVRLLSKLRGAAPVAENLARGVARPATWVRGAQAAQNVARPLEMVGRSGFEFAPTLSRGGVSSVVRPPAFDVASGTLLPGGVLASPGLRPALAGPGVQSVAPGLKPAGVPASAAEEWTSIFAPGRAPAAPTPGSLLMRSGELSFTPAGMARRLPPAAEDVTSMWSASSLPRLSVGAP